MTTDLKTTARTMAFGPRRGILLDARELAQRDGAPAETATIANFEAFDLVYRSLCAVMFNFVPLSGHPGGSYSSVPTPTAPMRT